MKKNLDITNLPFNEQIWPVLDDFAKSRFNCILFCGISRDSVPLSKFKHSESMTINGFPPISLERFKLLGIRFYTLYASTCTLSQVQLTVKKKKQILFNKKMSKICEEA